MGFWGSIGQHNASTVNREHEAEAERLREQIAFQKELQESGVDILAPQAGMLYNYQTDKNAITIVDIIELPEYLNTWESFIEEIVNQ